MAIGLYIAPDPQTVRSVHLPFFWDLQIALNCLPKIGHIALFLLRFDHCVSTYAALQAVYYYYVGANDR